MRFDDARAAGLALAPRLEPYADCSGALVVALARGGVGIGLGVARSLGLHLDLLLLRRLLMPRGARAPVCAANVAGTTFLDEELRAGGVEERPPEQFFDEALAELESSARACRGTRPAAELAGRTVLLIDNGVRTGSTMLAALRALRSCAPARVVAAAPVAAPEALAAVRSAADEFICLHTPDPFGHVGLWYREFRRPSDEEIRAMLQEG